jgi:ABC-type glycerol-3-phosphate transport system substrate-binding protein
MSEDHTSTRRRMLQAVGLTSAAGVAGCVEGALFEEETPAAGSADAVTGWAWGEAGEALGLTVDPYAEQRDATVRIENVDHESYHDRFEGALTSGEDGPDFAMLESVVAPSSVDTGGLEDLSGRISSSLKDEFLAGTWETISDGDAVYALPWDVGPVGMFYRRDVYRQHGIDPTTIETWDQFIEEGEKLPDGVHMTNLPPNDYDGVWRRQFRQLGGQPFTEDGKVNVHSDTSRRVAENIKAMVDAGIASEAESWTPDWFEQYANGSIASLPAGAWMETTLRDSLPDTDGDWGVYELPAYESGGNHATNWGGSNLCLPSQTDGDAVDRAWDYVEWAMTSTEMHNRMLSEFGIFPAYEPAYEADVYDEALEFFGGQRARQVFVDLAPDVPGYRYTADTDAVSDAMNTYLARMIEGELSPAAAVQQAAEQVAEETDRELA